MRARAFVRRVGDFFFAVGAVAWPVIRALRWVALPAACLGVVGAAMAHGPWTGATVASAFLLIVVVYAMLLQLALEREQAACRWHEGQRRDLEASYSRRLHDLAQAKEQAEALRAQKAGLALQLSILEAQACPRDA